MPGAVVARELLVEVVDERLDRRGVRGVLGVGGRRVVVRNGRGRAHLHGLDVGGVVALRAAHVGVLADRAAGQELLRLRAAHRTAGRLDDHVVEAEPVEGLDVGLAVGGVRRVQPLVGDVEGVAVLHHELAAADQARAGTRFVAVLRLDLVEPHGQVLVRRVQVLHHEGEHLLVRRPEQVVVALAVLEPEDAVAVVGPAAGRLVGLARQQRRELQLLRADRVHLVADDLLDLLVDPQAQRQPGVDAGRRATDVARAHQQPVARDLGVHGVLSEGPHEQLRHSQYHRARLAVGFGRERSGFAARTFVLCPSRRTTSPGRRSTTSCSTARTRCRPPAGWCSASAAHPGPGSPRWPSSWSRRYGSEAVVVPMDGFHLHDEELARLDLSQRKGAPETFDVAGYLALLRRLRTEAGADGLRPGVRPVAASSRSRARSPYARSTGWSSPRATTCCTTHRAGRTCMPLLDEVWFVEADETDPARAAGGTARRSTASRATSRSDGPRSPTRPTPTSSRRPASGPTWSCSSTERQLAGDPQRRTDHRELERQPGERRGLEGLVARLHRVDGHLDVAREDPDQQRRARQPGQPAGSAGAAGRPRRPARRPRWRR